MVTWMALKRWRCGNNDGETVGVTDRKEREKSMLSMTEYQMATLMELKMVH